MTVRAVIEQFEQSFGQNFKKLHQGRQAQRRAFLTEKQSVFIKFSEQGFKQTEEVVDTITMLYNSTSAQIHSQEILEKLAIPVDGFDGDQIKLLRILIELTGSKETVILLNANSDN
jgi:hypothetical protein